MESKSDKPIRKSQIELTEIDELPKALLHKDLKDNTLLI